MLDTRYTDGEYVTLVCDNLNTHTKGAFYEAFEPERARTSNASTSVTPQNTVAGSMSPNVN
jgi:hypothetical protein